MTILLNYLLAGLAGAFLYIAVYTIVAVRFILPLVLIGTISSAAGFICLAYFIWALVHTKYIVVQHPPPQ